MRTEFKNMIKKWKKTNMQTLNAATNWVRTGQKVTHSMQMLLSIASCWFFSLMSLLLPFLDVHLPLDLYELRFRCGDWKATHVCWSQQMHTAHNFRACVKRTRLMSSTARKKHIAQKWERSDVPAMDIVTNSREKTAFLCSCFCVHIEPFQVLTVHWNALPPSFTHHIPNLKKIV